MARMKTKLHKQLRAPTVEVADETNLKPGDVIELSGQKKIVTNVNEYASVLHVRSPNRWDRFKWWAKGLFSREGQC